MSNVLSDGLVAEHEHGQASARAEVLREATVMVLYVSVVEIAEFAGLPEAHSSHGSAGAPSEGQLLAILWGTAVGLALAHWFAFRLAAGAFTGERITPDDRRIALVHVAAAMAVAALSSVPLLLFSDGRAQKTAAYVPAVIIGVVGTFLARHSGRSRARSIAYGTAALSVGVVVALLKSTLGH